MRSTLVLAAAFATALVACGEGSKPAAPAGGPAPAASGGAPAEKPDRARLAAAYDKGLDFLASKQKDGIWSVQDRPHAGFTALAVTPMLDRPGGVRDADKPIVAKSLPWLASQLDADGGVKATFTSNYETSVVIMALAASKDPKWKPDIDRAAAYIKKLQYTEEKDPSYGGIGYGDDGPRSDVSNTAYALASLEAAGVPKSDPVYQRAVVFLQRNQNRKENEAPGEPSEWTDKDTGKKVVRGNDGGSVYFPGNAEHTGYDVSPDGALVLKSYGSMTYALLHCYHLAGLPNTDGRVKAAADWVANHWTLDRNPGMPEAHKSDGLYYYYASIGKTLPSVGIDTLKGPGGRAIDWRAELSARLLAGQSADGHWANTNERWIEADPVLATSYALTALRPCVR